MTIPNVISFTRLLVLAPLTLVLTAQGELCWGLLTFYLCGVTDWVDGVIAERFDMKSRLGAIIDPLGDAAGTIAAILGLVIVGAIGINAVTITGGALAFATALIGQLISWSKKNTRARRMAIWYTTTLSTLIGIYLLLVYLAEGGMPVWWIMPLMFAPLAFALSFKRARLEAFIAGQPM